MKLIFSREAEEALERLARDPGMRRILKDVTKALTYMETNLRHPSLHTHEFISQKGRAREKLFVAYAQNKTPGAYRIFWHYGPGRHDITIAAIVPHY